MSDQNTSSVIFAAQSAAAITSGIFAVTTLSAIAKEWHNGVTELYYEIGELAILSENLSHQYKGQCGSGVYSYDVDEPLGEILAKEILANTYDREKIKLKLKELISQFYSN